MRELAISPERVRELLDYCQETGCFYWRTHRGGRAIKGASAGSLRKDGYVLIVVDWAKVMAHRVAWAHVHGQWPKEQIDHINGVRSDNRFANLREATNGQNQHNLCGPKAGNRTGFLGVTFHPQSGKYRARIKVAGKAFDCGLHSTPDAAHQAYLEAKAVRHSHLPAGSGGAK